MNRIDEKFKIMKDRGEKAFIPYVCGGDPSLEYTEKIIYALEEAGCHIIEVGIPFSDPLADGPVIQAASLRSINGGFKLDKFFDTVKNIRKKSNVALVAMVYYSTIFGYGKEKFINNCLDSGLDGIIVPDLPYEEYDEISALIENTDLYCIPLIAITSGKRMPTLVKNSKGFIYCVSSLGVTGERKTFDKRIFSFINRVKEETETPVCVGFGISSKDDVKLFEKDADGVIIGSAIVRRIFESDGDLDKLKSFIKEIK
ncbi:MAG: tryptophan synthase subunit alpha [Clostridiales bacterium]|nr:tryptophan synthase subunit alpha [Clostridiales bacterium]